jgi:hypothetical protein
MSDHRIIELETDLCQIKRSSPHHFLPLDQLVAITEPSTKDFPMNRLGIWQSAHDADHWSGPLISCAF